MTTNQDIEKQIDLFFNLQGIDAQIYCLKSEAEEKPKDIAQLKALIENKKAGIKEAEEKLKSFQLKHKDKDVALGSKEGEIKKLESQLYQIKTNKEYTAMINEIESRKADNSLLEEDIINLMDNIDQAKAGLEDEKRKFSHESEKIDSEIKAVEKQVSNINAKISELNKARQELLPAIDPKLLQEYERVLIARNGQALADVVNGACGGCFMQLPPQIINEIKMRQHIIRCENCQRMLYIANE